MSDFSEDAQRLLDRIAAATGSDPVFSTPAGARKPKPQSHFTLVDFLSTHANGYYQCALEDGCADFAEEALLLDIMEAQAGLVPCFDDEGARVYHYLALNWMWAERKA